MLALAVACSDAGTTTPQRVSATVSGDGAYGGVVAVADVTGTTAAGRVTAGRDTVARTYRDGDVAVVEIDVDAVAPHYGLSPSAARHALRAAADEADRADLGDAAAALRTAADDGTLTLTGTVDGVMGDLADVAAPAVGCAVEASLTGALPQRCGDDARVTVDDRPEISGLPFELDPADGVPADAVADALAAAAASPSLELNTVRVRTFVADVDALLDRATASPGSPPEGVAVTRLGDGRVEATYGGRAACRDGDEVSAGPCPR